MAQVFSLSEAASIGLHTMILLAQNKEGMNIQTITERTEFSFHHVAKVLQRLSKHNFLHSTRGPHGGFLLRKDPESITLLDIYECIEGKIEIQPCPFGYDNCVFENCFMENVSQSLTLQMREFLRSKTLSSYLSPEHITKKGSEF